MKKIIIISYFFPPCNFVGAERTSAWTKHLHKKGYHPIVITRQWNDGQTDLVDKLQINEAEHIKYDTHEEYRLPYKRTFRDWCAERRFLKPLQKILTLLEIISSTYFVRALPYSNIYQKARNILQNDPSINIVIASGRPFRSFHIGYQLKKEYNVKWIPDYRDEWTTHQNPTNKNLLWKLINKLEKRSEKKWTSNANGFITVSDNWKNSIATYIGKKGHVIMNGYDKMHPSINHKSDTGAFKIVYAGTLYPSQKIEIFIEAFKNISLDTDKKMIVSFIGANIIPSEKIRLEMLKGSSSNIEILDRTSKIETLKEMQKADALILTSFDNVAGWYPAKLFEYYASGIPIILCPSDNDVIEAFIRDTNCGICINSVQECEEVLSNWSKSKMNGKSIVFNRNIDEGMKFSREHQTYKLASYLDKL